MEAANVSFPSCSPGALPAIRMYLQPPNTPVSGRYAVVATPLDPVMCLRYSKNIKLKGGRVCNAVFNLEGAITKKWGDPCTPDYHKCRRNSVHILELNMTNST